MRANDVNSCPADSCPMVIAKMVPPVGSNPVDYSPWRMCVCMCVWQSMCLWEVKIRWRSERVCFWEGVPGGREFGRVLGQGEGEEHVAAVGIWVIYRRRDMGCGNGYGLDSRRGVVINMGRPSGTCMQDGACWEANSLSDEERWYARGRCWSDILVVYDFGPIYSTNLSHFE